MIKLEWSARKNRLNVLKHGVDFKEASTVFDDPAHVSVSDPDHSFNENRYITIGMSTGNRLVIMAHTFENDKIRIITARKPTRTERRKYEEEDFDA
jgi:uncharacterized DUF497 family protein